jgi:putative YjhG/YagF family dehydratase
MFSLAELLESGDRSIYELRSHAPGPAGRLPLTADDLRQRPSGDLFGWSHDVAMGWQPEQLRRPEFLILSTQGGVRGEQEAEGRKAIRLRRSEGRARGGQQADGKGSEGAGGGEAGQSTSGVSGGAGGGGGAVALGYHTGHWEVGLLVRAAAEELRAAGAIPFASFCSDPCDGRTQGTPGMMDSLPYRNDAAIVFRRLIRSLPTRSGVLGIATCDKGLPAMMMALAGCAALPAVLVPGGVMLAGEPGSEDTAKAQTIGVRFTHGLLTLDEASEIGCHTCASPGGGCQFLGTAATSQVVGEALGLTLLHAALAPSGQPIWRDMARRSARALIELAARQMVVKQLLTSRSIENAMVVHAAFGGSTNLLLHIPAIAHAAGLARPSVNDWRAVNRRTPRLVDALPNGPVGHPTVRVFLAGGVPEVMLHLRRLGLIDTTALTASGESWGTMLDWWQDSERRHRLRAWLKESDGVDPDDVILSPDRARSRGLTSTVAFPAGNIAPEGGVVKSTAIDPTVIGADGCYRKLGPTRVFTSEKAAIAAIKSQSDDRLRPGDILVLIGRGPLGAGMEEIYQITAALRHLPWGKEVAVITDARFSGVSTGACIGHVGPEALAGGPIGKLRDGDWIEIVIDRERLEGSIHFVGARDQRLDPEAAARVLDARTPHPQLAPDPELPDDTRLWAILQQAGGGAWGGCVYDVQAIAARLNGAEPRLAGSAHTPARALEGVRQ